MTENPYHPPKGDPYTQSSWNTGESDPAIAPPVVVEHLRCTRQWVKFCSLTGYVASAFLIVIAAITIYGTIDKTPERHLILIGSFYAILAVLFIIPSLWLSRYEKSITHLNISNRIEDLEQAIAHQRAFWRQMAIMILIMLIIFLLTVAFSALLLLRSQ